MGIFWTGIQLLLTLANVYIVIDWIRIHLGYKKVGKW